MRSGWLCLATAWLAVHGPAQVRMPSSPYAAVSGVVLNDATGTPLRRAMVTLSTLDTPPLEAVTYSESNGAFGFTNVPPGKYRLSVDKDGFQQAWFGASTPKRPPGTLTLAAGDVRYGITFRLRPLGSISGVALDPDGDPIPSVSVRLLREIYQRRKPTYTDEASAITDDRGRYRLSDVVPGQDVVMAAEQFQPPTLIQTEASAGQTAPQRVYAPQFYPDSSRLSSAEPVVLAPGKDLDGVDFHLAARLAASLRGKVAVPEDMSANSVAEVTVFPQDVPDFGDRNFGAGAGPPEYTFEIPNLLPGPYVVVATLNTPGHNYRCVERIELPPGGQELTLHPDRGIDLAGRVDLEGGGARPAGPFHVTLAPGDALPAPDQPHAEVKPDGTFVLPGVVPGVWDIDAGPVPRGGFIKSMLLGDQDVLTEDMVITSSTREPLRIVISTRGGVVTGTVTVPRDVVRSARARVLLAPSGKYEHVLSFYNVGAADDTGHFEFTAVTPGRYRLYAFEELDPDAFEDPGFLKPYEGQSEAFDVPEGGRVSREVPLIPAAAQAAARN